MSTQSESHQSAPASDGAGPYALPDPGDAAAGAAAAALPDGGPRLYGVIDVLRLDRIAGWAIDRTDPKLAAEVEIRREGRVVATLRADRLRKDLEKGGLGTGRYGFACPLDPPLEPGFEFTVTALARSADGSEVELRRAGAGAAPEPRVLERRVLERLYSEVSGLRREVAERLPAAPAAPEPPSAAFAEALQRVELAQARLEAALGEIERPAPAALGGLRLIAASGLAVALASLGIGLWSLLG